MSFLAPTDYPAIRAAIDLSIDKNVLPDETIRLPIFLGQAESYVLSRDPLAATRIGMARQHLKSAIILYTAANLVSSIPFYVRESFGDHSYTRSEVNSAKLISDLRARANQELNAALNETTDTSSLYIPELFGTAMGRRGQ